MSFDLNQTAHKNLSALVLAILIIVTGILSSTFWTEPVTSADIDPQVLQLQDRERTLDLAIEFGFDPLVVDVVRQLSRKAFEENYCSCPTWRFVRDGEDMAYLMLSIIQIESGGDIDAYNPGGPAYGLTQMVMSTARMYRKDVTQAELLTLPTNLTLATAHFVDLLERFHGNSLLAVVAWNRGSGAVARSISLGENPDNGYARTVFTRAVLRNATE